ncbi:MAG TPA: DUF4388 domain-containing protein [Polyangia bacterium]|nr:DUF4388 domain-containing protein [Polyangia bacterium]
MKLLIIAGPYEADRVRRAVVQAGFEAVAVEPGESLSGWITASRPDLIVLAPQVVNADPAIALSKVRAVPRGRVPTLLVGDPDDEAKLRDLADGFLARPLSMSDLVARVRARLGSGERRLATGELGIPAPMTDVSSGEFGRLGTPGGGVAGASGPKAPGTGPGSTPSQISSGGGSGSQRPLPTLKPLVAAAASSPPPVARARSSEAGALFNKLAESIDAALDAEMLDFARAVGALRPSPTPASTPPQALAPPPKGLPSPAPPEPPTRRPPEDLFERTPMAPMTALAAAAALPLAEDTSITPSMPALFDAPEPGEDHRDETRQKTVEVPRDVFAKMIADRIASARDAGAAGDGGVPAPVESGKIADSDVAAQFGRLYLQRLTGRLVLSRGPIEKVIYFDRGSPILGTSSDPEDRMGEMLVRQGRLTPLQLVRASEDLARAERRLGVVLVELGFIKPSELPVVVRRHFEEIIHSAFSWEDGEWSLSPGQPNQEIVLLDEHPAAIILAGIRRKYSAARLARCLGGGKQVFHIGEDALASEVVQQMGMTPEERALVPRFDGLHTLDEVRAEARTRDEIVFGVAWALSVLGQLDRLEPRAGELPKPAAPSNGAAATREVAVSPGPLRADRARVLAHHALVEEGDYFQVLGLPRGASDADVRGAHARLQRELTPTSLDPGLVAELGAELRAIRVVLDEALRVLGTPGLRERYEMNLPSAPEYAAG